MLLDNKNPFRLDNNNLNNGLFAPGLPLDNM